MAPRTQKRSVRDLAVRARIWPPRRPGVAGRREGAAIHARSEGPRDRSQAADGAP